MGSRKPEKLPTIVTSDSSHQPPLNLQPHQTPLPSLLQPGIPSQISVNVFLSMFPTSYFTFLHIVAPIDSSSFKGSDRLSLRHRHPSLLSKGVRLGGDRRAGVSTGTVGKRLPSSSCYMIASISKSRPKSPTVFFFQSKDQIGEFFILSDP
ncbi:unnamed protein product [Lactuca saligna]|uniref:Uncharacterized protein n=1 Tax=Lactuca saligna TaxID=75948 RepID=A0AA35Z7Q1_LACSI|nr:unnamed protein product [Lactuca saligna]